MFGKVRKKVASNVADSSEWDNTIKPKDGHIHAMFIDSFQGLGEGAVIQIEEKYTNQLNVFLGKLQDSGYEIVDVKFNSFREDHMSSKTKYQTLILYK